MKFPIEGHLSRINIDLGAYLKNRRFFHEREELNFSPFRDYLAVQDRKGLEHHYTHGLCGVLATVLHQLLGWPVAAIYQDGKIDEENVMHMGVFNPDTMLYTDAKGIEQTKTEFMGRYPSFSFGRCSVILPKKIDYFKPDQDSNHIYCMCLLEHIPILLPHLAPLVKEIEEAYNDYV